MAALDAWLAAHGTIAQVAILICAFAAFAALERCAPIAQARDARRSRWGANFALAGLNGLTLSALPITGLLAAQWAAQHELGVIRMLNVGPEAAFCLGLAARSWASWATHAAMHKVPMLWRLHRVHHSDEFFDVSTTGRFHPLEFVAGVPFSVAAVVFFGVPPAAVIVCDLAGGALSVFHHANLRIPARLEEALRWIIVTPDLHRIHHSSRQEETDSNFGVDIPLWDHLFGTYRGASRDSAALGLKEWRGVQSRSLMALLANPFR
jgi:sterol desaturase/sphingolipid hydroxylase (fatty acid hydroxylase superfamily)